MDKVINNIKHLIGEEITVRYSDDGIEKEKTDVIKEIIKNEDGTYNIVFMGDIKKI